MEADLQRFYGIDYRDRWRGGDLTLRRIAVLVRHLPPESAVALIERDGKPHWTLEAELIDTLRRALTSTKKGPAEPHPLRPKPQPKRMTPERKRKLAAARARRAERLRMLEEG